MGSPARISLVAVVSVVLALVVAACGFGGGVSTADDPLVTVETRGGECFAAPCGQVVVLSRDGGVHSAAKPPNDLGMVSAEQLAAVDAAIRLTDFEALKSHPFTGECPVAFDGQELIFEFSTPAGPERLASCEVEIDYGLPLFVAVANALGPFVPLPLT